MKKTNRLLIALLVIMLSAIPWVTAAAESSVFISGTTSGEVGTTITVNVTYKGDSLGYANGQLIYDNSKLQYVSGGSSQGDAGLVALKKYAGDASGKISFKVKFKLISSGSSDLELSTLETQNLDGDQDMGMPSTAKTVKVKKGSQTAKETTQKSATTAPTSQTELQESSQGDSDIIGESELNPLEPEDSQKDINFIILGVVAAVLVIGIAGITVYLKKKHKK